MNILYLHGLDSKLSPEKRKILEKFGKVFARDLNYYENQDTIAAILKLDSGTKIDTVIGSSMGGFAGYHVANAFNRPALLFNPALKRRSVQQNIPESPDSHNNLKYIVIGQQDEVVVPTETLAWLSQHFNPVTDLQLHLVPRMGHNIPVEVFERELQTFFGLLGH